MIDRFWYSPAPAQRLAAVRIAVGLYACIYLLVRGFSLTSVARFSNAEFAPVGPVTLLSSPLPMALVYAALALALVSGAAFVVGYRYRWTAPWFALSFLWVTAYRSSWGMVFHTENMVALHLILLAFTPAADAWSLDAREPVEAHGRYGWGLRALSTITVTTYALAGVAKLKLGGAAWVDGALLREQVAYDNLRKIELGSMYSPLGTWLVSFAWPFRGLAWASMLMELGAPLALVHRYVGRVWSLAVWSFHLGVLSLMAIGFPYQLSLVAYASFFPLERLAPYLRKLLKR